MLLIFLVALLSVSVQSETLNGIRLNRRLDQTATADDLVVVDMNKGNYKEFDNHKNFFVLLALTPPGYM